MVAFQSYGIPLDTATEFKYLGRVFTVSYGNCPEVVENLWKARSRWSQLSSILVREGADPRTSVFSYKAVLQATLLFGLETWVMNPRIGMAIGGFNHRVDHRLVLIQLTHDMEVRW